MSMFLVENSMARAPIEITSAIDKSVSTPSAASASLAASVGEYSSDIFLKNEAKNNFCASILPRSPSAYPAR